MNNKVTVIIPVYNVSIYLRKCVKSVMQQNYLKLEIILVDDGSTDGSGLICDELKKADNRIIVIHKANGGLSSARNAGLRIATGNFVSFLDSDDYLEQNLFSSLIPLFEQEKVDLIEFNANEVFSTFTRKFMQTPTTKMNLDNSIKHLLLGDGVFRSVVWNKLFRHSLLKDLLFDEELRYGEDTPFLFNYLLKCNIVYHYDSIFYNYMRRETSLIGITFSSNKMLSIKASKNILEKIKEVELPYVKYANCSIANNCMILIEELFVTESWRKKFKGDYLKIKKEMSTINTKDILPLFIFKHRIKYIVIRYFSVIYKLKCYLFK